MAKKLADELSDAEAEQRANAAMLRALTTPYRPQSEMKIGPKPKSAARVALDKAKLQAAEIRKRRAKRRQMAKKRLTAKTSPKST
mgnify:CR=1 FL=1